MPQCARELIDLFQLEVNETSNAIKVIIISHWTHGAKDL